MDIVKKNLLSIICGVFALAAVGFYFYSQGDINSLNTKLKARDKDRKDLTVLLNARRQLPAIDPNTATAPELTDFPTKDIIEWGTKEAEKMKGQAEDMRTAARKISQNAVGDRKTRSLLRDKCLPSPDAVAQQEFRDKYDDYMRSFPSAQVAAAVQNAKQNEQPGGLISRLNACIPVTQAEIQARETDITNEWKKKLQTVGGVVINQAAIDAGIKKAVNGLDLQMHYDHSKSHMLYINPEHGITYYNPIQQAKLNSRLPNETEIWFAQLGIWIQEDIIDAIIETNNLKGPDGKPMCTDIQNAIVKRLEVMAIPNTYVGPGTGDGQPRYQVSCTGRTSNSLYDVMQVRLVVLLDARRIHLFINQLNNNRFINVTHIDEIAGVDREGERERGYWLGPDAVVRANLMCEVLMMRDWTKQWMPREVRKERGIADPVAPGGGSAAAQ